MNCLRNLIISDPLRYCCAVVAMLVACNAVFADEEAVAAGSVVPAGPALGNPAGNRYTRTTLALADAPPQWRSDFASKSLLLLAEIYLAESDLALREAEDREGAAAAKLRGWSRAVASYGEQLLLVLDDVELGFPVELLPLGDRGVALQIADRTVMLNHPRADQQAAYELRVLAGFCSIRNCNALTPPAEPEPIPMTPPTVAVDWQFSDDGPVCSSGGVAIQFNSTANLARVRPLCAQALQELLALELELRWQKRHGVTVDYESLDISATPRRPEHLVRLNNNGDSMLLSLPLLHGSEGLLAAVSNWLYQRVETASRSAPLVLTADQFGWR